MTFLGGVQGEERRPILQFHGFNYTLQSAQRQEVAGLLS